MTSKFNMIPDIAGHNGFGTVFSDTGFAFTLTANVASTVNVPTDNQNYLAVMSYTDGIDVWVANNTTATLPTGVVTASASRLKPPAKFVKSGDTLSFITSNASSPAVGVEFFVVSPYTN